ncbi:hypothetical protein Pyrde_1312 [Pyrodictium delaneyi]|uniref:Uncharacterized protein n=1 Tax=Pyrodictium delaneyi TaxID=1273541 RepID=A0A0P0N505_9CREN|nr:hypothetical protein [Pyrodictium delaneyi]ALL01358.1 hypothetical protein Pyrde_1312 [Pyrodictium delaneyi]
MAAIVARLLQALGLGGNQEPSLHEKIDQVIVKLELIEDNVAELRYKFEKRSRELFEKVITLLRRGEKSRAAIYAGEVSQVRNILKMVMAVENLVIMTKERLKTVRDTRELGQTLMVFGAALEEVKDQVRAIYPNLNLAFEELSRSVKNMIVETSVDAIGDIDPAVISSSAVQVLQEAMKKAEERIKSEFPEPPVEPVIQLQPSRQQAAAAVALAAAAGPAPAAAIPASYRGRRKPSGEELEKLVLDYIKQHNGFLDIRDFTATYNVSKSEVLRALHSLAEKGLIALA